LPGLALPAAVIFRMLLPDPGDRRVIGVNPAETPLGNPVIEKATAVLKPPLTATLTLMLLPDPALNDREFTEAVAWKAGDRAASRQWPTKTDASTEPRPEA